MDELSSIGIGLGIVAEIQIDTGKNTCEIDDENQIK
jgi:hypothetical protein